MGQALGFWNHNIYLGNGVYTMGDGAPQHHELVWQRFEQALPPSFAGLSVLDIAAVKIRALEFV